MINDKFSPCPFFNNLPFNLDKQWYKLHGDNSIGNNLFKINHSGNYAIRMSRSLHVNLYSSIEDTVLYKSEFANIKSHFCLIESIGSNLSVINLPINLIMKWQLINHAYISLMSCQSSVLLWKKQSWCW